MQKKDEIIARKFSSEDTIRKNLMQCEKRDLVELILQYRFDLEMAEYRLKKLEKIEK